MLAYLGARQSDIVYWTEPKGTHLADQPNERTTIEAKAPINQITPKKTRWGKSPNRANKFQNPKQQKTNKTQTKNEIKTNKKQKTSFFCQFWLLPDFFVRTICFRTTKKRRSIKKSFEQKSFDCTADNCVEHRFQKGALKSIWGGGKETRK